MRECACARPRAIRSGLEKVGQGLYSIRAGEIWKEDPSAPRAASMESAMMVQGIGV